MPPSPANTLTVTDIQNWKKDLLLYTLPVIAIYLTSTLYVIQTPGNVFSFNDFIPSAFTLGSMFTYILSSSLGIIKKYLAG